MPISRSQGYLPSIGDGFSALDSRAWRDRIDGFAVVDGLAVSVDSGLTLSIASGTATVGESSGTVQTVSLGSSTTITLNSADSTNPRKDTIYIDTNGTVQAEQGTAESALPSGNDRFTTYQPEPPLPSTEGTILAEVWVGAGVTSLQSADIRDHRYPADIVADDVFSQAVSTESLVIGGRLYEEDDNSPWQPSGTSSDKFTIAGSYDEVIVIPERVNVGFDQLRFNGKSDSNYRYVTNGDTETTGQTEIDLSRFLKEVEYFSVNYNNSDGDIGFSAHWSSPRVGTGVTVWGGYQGAVSSLDSFTGIDSGGTNRSLNARVYGRAMDI